MDEKLRNLILSNIFDYNHLKISDDIKVGLFYETNCTSLKYKYLKNLCSYYPEKFEVTNVENIYSKICMMMSYNDYSLIDDKNLIEHEISGVLPKNSHVPVLYIRVNNPKSIELYPYNTKKYLFDFHITKLTVEEQLCLIFNMIKIYNTEKDLFTRKIKINAYLDRLFFDKNDYHPLIKRILYYYDSLINEDYKELEHILLESNTSTTEDLLKFPIIFRRDVELQLADVYFKQGYYDKSLIFYQRYNCSKEIIDCLLALKRTEEAIDKINKELQCLDISKGHAKKVLYCEYCIKSGWITRDTSWFDKGYYAYPSYEPLEQKAVFYYKNKEYKKAKDVYAEILKIVPKNDKILFGYASVKILLEEYFDCIDIFRRLLENDKRNPEYLRNLSLCYYKTNNIENCMKSLKSNAMCDNKSMDLYLKLVIKNNIKNEILWCISKMDDIRYLEYIKKYLIEKGIFSHDEIYKAMQINPKLRDNTF